MRVVYITHAVDSRTGVGIFSKTLIEGLAPHGVEPVVFTSESIISHNPFRLLHNLFRIRKEIKKSQLVHALDGFPYGIVAMLTAWGTGVPVVVSTLGTGALQKIGHPLYGPLLRWTYRHATHVVALSSFMARCHKEVLPDVPVLAINPGVDSVWWGSTTSDPGYGKYLLSVGAIKPRKGYHLLIPIIARILKENPQLSWKIVGNPDQSPSYSPELFVAFEREGIHDRVEFLKNISREELRSLYQHALVHVLAPIDVGGDVEGFGMVFIEAAASGCPSVATSGTGADDAILEGKSGYLVSKDSPDDLYFAMDRIISDSTLREKLTLGAKAFAEQMDWSQKISEYKKLYDKVLS